ncbi:MAG: hypothetical protein MHMPM18_001655, partial [Marteilia pararefringens]
DRNRDYTSRHDTDANYHQYFTQGKTIVRRHIGNNVLLLFSPNIICLHSPTVCEKEICRERERKSAASVPKDYKLSLRESRHSL